LVNTRERIQEVALALFTEKGYDKTSLREISEQLGVTKAALHYHFPSKDAIVNGAIETASATVKEFLDWAFALPRTAESRREIVLRLSERLQNAWQPLIRFAQANQTQIQLFPQGERAMDQVRQVFALLADPEADAVTTFRSMLAGMALMMSIAPTSEFQNVKGNVNEVALKVALDLIATPPNVVESAIPGRPL
jgi:AcrR family transcriptional regulator